MKLHIYTKYNPDYSELNKFKKYVTVHTKLTSFQKREKTHILWKEFSLKLENGTSCESTIID